MDVKFEFLLTWHPPNFFYIDVSGGKSELIAYWKRGISPTTQGVALQTPRTILFLVQIVLGLHSWKEE